MQTTGLDDAALREWAKDYELHFDLEREKVKASPEFREWADSAVSSTVETERGSVLGWTLEDCTRKWVQEYGFEFPSAPVPRPAWATESSLQVVDPGEASIRFSHVVTRQVDGKEITMRLTRWIQISQDEPCTLQNLISVDGLGEDLLVVDDDLDEAINALNLARSILQDC